MSESTLVYSSELGRIVTPPSGNSGRRGKGKEGNVCSTPPTPSDGVVRLSRQTKGRGGGTVIVISGVPLQGAALKELAGALKKKCGCGGTVKDGVIEIQGEHRELLQQELTAKGYRV